MNRNERIPSNLNKWIPLACIVIEYDLLVSPFSVKLRRRQDVSD
jgi:hypothetical protein